MNQVAVSILLTVVLSAPAFAAEPAVQPDSRGQVNLLGMGDWGSNTAGQRTVATTMKQYVESEQRRFDALLTAGDNVYIDLQNIFDPKWQQMFEQMYDRRVLNFPFYPTLGNHDYQHNRYLIEWAYARSYPQSRWKFPDRWYRLDFPIGAEKPLVTVLMLDSNKPLLGERDWNTELAWLKNELAKPRTATWLMCVAHHPMFSNGDHGDNGVLQNTWGPLFEKANVDIYLAGHDHDMQHLELPGKHTTYLMVGGGGAGTRAMRVDKRGPFSRAQHGFGDLQFTDSAVRVRYVGGDDGSITHEFTRALDGKISVTQSLPSDVAKPRTIKSITRDPGEAEEKK
jgi:tartrate-resistant acid phosphatase type 5